MTTSSSSMTINENRNVVNFVGGNQVNNQYDYHPPPAGEHPQFGLHRDLTIGI
jgi:hypothetical protein